MLEGLRQKSLVDSNEKGHGCREDGAEEAREERDVGVLPSHGEEKRFEHLAARGEEGELGRYDQYLSFECECMPRVDNVGYVEAFKQVRKGK